MSVRQMAAKSPVQVLLGLYEVPEVEIYRKSGYSAVTGRAVLRGVGLEQVAPVTAARIRALVSQRLRRAGCPLAHDDIWGRDALKKIREMAREAA
jgi:hypothetical protein